MQHLLQARFRFLTRYARLLSALRCRKYKLFGMHIDHGVVMGRIVVNWPNQVSIGRNSQIGDSSVFDYCYGVPMPGPNIHLGSDCFVGRGVEFNVRQYVRVGNDCLIAAGVRFIDHDHGIAPGELIRSQPGPERPIEVGNDVWIGVNAVILKGVKIGDSAVIAAGAIVNRAIPEAEIWGGVPARRIGKRMPT